MDRITCAILRATQSESILLATTVRIPSLTIHLLLSFCRLVPPLEFLLHLISLLLCRLLPSHALLAGLFILIFLLISLWSVFDIFTTGLQVKGRTNLALELLHLLLHSVGINVLQMKFLQDSPNKEAILRVALH